MNIGIKLSISLPIVFVKHYLLISGLDRMYSIDVLTIYWAAKYYIRLRCAHNVFVRNIGPVTPCEWGEFPTRRRPPVGLRESRIKKKRHVVSRVTIV